MCKNIVEETPQMKIWRPCWITKTTNTHSEYVILFAFPPQQLLHHRASRTLPHLCNSALQCLPKTCFMCSCNDGELLASPPLWHCKCAAFQSTRLCTYIFLSFFLQYLYHHYHHHQQQQEQQQRHNPVVINP